MKKTVSGFTIVELLIVIVIIAILAAITIVAYNGIQERARISRVSSDLTNVSKKIELYYVDKGEYPDTVAEVQAADIRMSTTAADAAIYCGNASGYAIVTSEKDDHTGRQFKIGKGIALAEILPKVSGWSGANLCAVTPYPSIVWSDLW